MDWFVTVTARFVEASRRVREEKWRFSSVFACVFGGSVFALNTLGLLPETSSPVLAVPEPRSVVSATSTMPLVHIEEPVRIEIAAISLSVTIANPTTTDIEALDSYLLRGAVRYPTSARLGEAGNVVLFGHSSYLPVVGNQAYKTFNGIQKLAVGDTIMVSSVDTVYTYRVREVAKESAASNAGISLEKKGRQLTLATCNSFGAKSDRFVVTADFVESHPVSTR